MRARAPDAGTTDTPAADSGRPLPPTVRLPLESTLGADLRDVRVHDGGGAQAMARSLHAKAFTHGEHIWLGPQQRADDLPLMAHEVAHVMQQSSGRARPDTVQRAPADHRHPEDGGDVMGRMQSRIAEAEEGHEDEQPTGDAATRAHAARVATHDIDRGERAQQQAELQPAAAPTSIGRRRRRRACSRRRRRPSRTSPRPPSRWPRARPGRRAAPAVRETRWPMAARGQRNRPSALREHAAAAARDAVTVPAAVSAPTDAGGQPLMPDSDADGRVAGLALHAQTLREEGSRCPHWGPRSAPTHSGCVATWRWCRAA